MKSLLKTIGKRLPLLAAILGVGLAMARSPLGSKDISAWFEYQPPTTSPYSQANVQSPANYIYTSSDERCDDELDIPCKIQVSSSYYHTSGGVPVLNTSGTVTNISASVNSATGTYYVNGGSLLDFSNQSN